MEALYTNYFVYLLLIMAIPIFCQAKVKGAFTKYAKVKIRSGKNGAEVAREILSRNGITDVRIEETRGVLSDHYDPRAKVIRLSREIYHGSTVASTAIAAHEVGHAIQHATGYKFLEFRSKLAPIAITGTKFSWVFILIGLLTTLTNMLMIGIILMSLGVLFQFVTLPVEFNASSRALAQVEGMGLVSVEEKQGAKAILSAAALTYVGATAVALLELVRLIYIARGRD